MDYKKIADDVSKEVLAYLQDTTDWKVVKHTKLISVSSKPSQCFPGTLYRAEALMEMPVDKLFPFIYIPEYRSKWDKAIQSYNLLETVDEDTFIFHNITHSYGFGLISPREFVYILHIKRYDGNLMTTNSISVDHPSCLPSPRYIRGCTFPSGYAFSPHPENPDHTKLVAIVQVDLGGVLKPSLIDSVMPMTLINFVNDLKTGYKSQKGNIL
ncbi:stAR-related lipid transfer protein 6 [Elgaria multicarinata webbii]|uniref:stAR-related lipid transfer protein 6 n=1 Tax=Elgaria multicarinata webbii TaxID=159646 RepID=UPI002FCD2CE9